MTEPEPPQSDEAEQSFIAQKLGDLYAESAKLIASLNQMASTDAGRVSGGNRHLLHIVIVLLIILIVVLTTHAAFEAGWFGG